VRPDRPRSLVSSAWRFAMVGGLNTVVTGVLLTVLAQVIDPRLAYTIVFAAGVAFSVAMAGGFVFGVRMTRRLAISYTALYVGVYVVGLVVVAVAVAAGMPEAWSGLVVLVTAPLTFLGGRVLVARQPHAERVAQERTAS